MPENQNLFYKLTENLKNTKNLFITIPDGTFYRYYDMLKLSGRYANALVAVGIKKNDRILVQTEKQIECIWLYLACLRLGAIYVPINPAYTLTETEYFITDSKPKLFVTTDVNKTTFLFQPEDSATGVHSSHRLTSWTRYDRNERFGAGAKLC